MPLIAKRKLGKLASLYLWEITETEEELREAVFLHPSDAQKFSGIRNHKKKMEFLALRRLLDNCFDELPEVHYHESGKPFLKNGFKLSMSHCFPYAAAIISKDLDVGIDLEVYRESFKRVAPKFMSSTELKAINPGTEVQQLIHFWGAKEVMVKITGNRRFHFKTQLKVAPFLFRQRQKTRGLIFNGDGQNPQRVKLYFEQLKELHLSYGWLD